jgi:hypothetical protein
MQNIQIIGDDVGFVMGKVAQEQVFSLSILVLI